MRPFVILLLSVCPHIYSQVTWDTLYKQKYLTTVPKIGIFRDITVQECGQMCRKHVDKCNIAIYDRETVNISNVSTLFELIYHFFNDHWIICYFTDQDVCKTFDEPSVRPWMVEVSTHFHTVIKLPSGKHLSHISTFPCLIYAILFPIILHSNFLQSNTRFLYYVELIFQIKIYF